MQSGGSVSSSQSIVRLQSGTGAGNLLQTELRFSQTDNQVRWIGNSSTTILTIDHTFDDEAAGFFSFKLFLDASETKVWLAYKAGDDQTWTLADGGGADKSYTLTPIVSSTTTRATFGIRSSATATMRFKCMDFYEGDGNGLPVRVAKADLVGKPLTTWGHPLPAIGPDTQIARLALLGGPAIVGQGWDIDISADYPLKNLYHEISPSPDAVWRSTGTTEEIPLAWDNTYDTRWGNSIAVMVQGCNFPTAVLEGQTGGGGWTTLATLDMDSGFDALTFDRTGDMVFASTSGSAVEGGRYVWRNEFAGAIVDLGNGHYRKVIRNTAGQWVLGANASRPKCRLYLDGIDGTEDSSGGTCAIWSTRAVAVVHNVSDYDQFRLRIPSGSNADGYWQIGSILIGGLAVVGKQHDLGWRWLRNPNAETFTSDAGTTYTRRKGKAGRTLTLTYNAGFDLTQLRDNSAAIDYLAADTGSPLATHEDVGFLLAELLEEIDSGEAPIGAIPAIPDAGSTLTDPWDFLYCRLSSGVGLDHVVGDERADDLYRTGPITLSEVV